MSWHVFVSTANADDGTAWALAVLPGDGTGMLGAAISSPVNLRPNFAAAADFNGDGKPDAVLTGFSNAGRLLAVFTNQGDGTFGRGARFILCRTIRPAWRLATSTATASWMLR